MSEKAAQEVSDILFIMVTLTDVEHAICDGRTCSDFRTVEDPYVAYNLFSHVLDNSHLLTVRM